MKKIIGDTYLQSNLIYQIDNIKKNLSLKKNNLDKSTSFIYGFIAEKINDCGIFFYDNNDLIKKFPKSFNCENMMFINATYFNSLNSTEKLNHLSSLICSSISNSVLQREKLIFATRKMGFNTDIEAMTKITYKDLIKLSNELNLDLSFLNLTDIENSNSSSKNKEVNLQIYEKYSSLYQNQINPKNLKNIDLNIRHRTLEKSKEDFKQTPKTGL